MAYPANIAFSFGSQTSGLTSQLDQNFTNLAVGLNGIGNGTSVLSSVAITTSSIGSANISGGTAIFGSANITTMSSSNVVITGGTAVLSTANVTTFGAAKINFGDGTTQNTASYLNTWTPYTPIISSTSGNLVTTSATGNFLTSGKTTFFNATLTLTNVGNATAINFTVPIGSFATGGSYVFVGRENSVTGNMYQGRLDQNTSVVSAIQTYGGAATIANGYVLIFSGVYQNA